MIQIFKIFHGIDIMEFTFFQYIGNATKNFKFNIIRREVTVLNILKKFHCTSICKILSLINQRIYGIPIKIYSETQKIYFESQR